MQNRKTKAVSVLLASSLLVSGCAITPGQFAKQRHSMTDVDVCGAVEDSIRTPGTDFFYAAMEERETRGLNYEKCQTLLNNRRAAIAALVVIGAAAAALAAQGGRGGGGGSTRGATADYSWAWDQFYNDRGQLVWACRGEQTGQFAPAQQCLGRPRIDATWPGWEAR